MKKYLPVLFLIMLSSQILAESCLLEPTVKQPSDDIFCLKNISVPTKPFFELCDLLTFNDGSRTVKKIDNCPSHVVAKCSVDLSYIEGSIIQHIYSKRDFTDQLRNLHKNQCENHTFGKGKWIP